MDVFFVPSFAIFLIKKKSIKYQEVQIFPINQECKGGENNVVRM